MQITRAAKPLRSEAFATLPRSETLGFSVGYTDTIADERISAADLDRLDAARGYFGVAYHYIIKPSGHTEIGRNPLTRSSRGRGTEATCNIWIGVVGGRDKEANRVSTITPEQREAVESLMQEIANVLQLPLEVTDYVENRTLRDQLLEQEEADEAQEETPDREQT